MSISSDPSNWLRPDKPACAKTQTEQDPTDSQASVLSELATAYETEIGYLTPMVRENFVEFLGEHPGIKPGWPKRAIKEAVGANARSWNYVRAILRRWAMEGGPEPEGEEKPEVDEDEFIKQYLARQRERGNR